MLGSQLKTNSLVLNFTPLNIKTAIESYYQSLPWYVIINQSINPSIIDDEIVFLEKYHRQINGNLENCKKTLNLEEIELLCSGLSQFHSNSTELNAIKKQIMALFSPRQVKDFNKLTLLLNYLKQIKLLSFDVINALTQEAKIMSHLLDSIQAIHYFNFDQGQFIKLSRHQNLESISNAIQYFYLKQQCAPELLDLLLSHPTPEPLSKVCFTLQKLKQLDAHIKMLKNAQLPQLDLISKIAGLSLKPILWAQRPQLNKITLNFILTHQQPENLCELIALWTQYTNDFLITNNFNNVMTYSDLLTHSSIIECMKSKPQYFFIQNHFENIIQFCTSTHLETLEEIITELKFHIDSIPLNEKKLTSNPNITVNSLLNIISSTENNSTDIKHDLIEPTRMYSHQ